MEIKNILGYYMGRLAYFYYAVFFGSIGLIAADTFIPSIPAIARNFATRTSVIQETIAIFMLGFCLARFIVALLSDGVGRKVPLTFCFLLLFVGSIICQLSTTEHVFLFGRLLQGIGAGGSNVLARIIIRDITTNECLGKYNSFYSMFAMTATLLAPLLGGILQTYFDWRATFTLLAILSALALVTSLFFYRETNTHKNIALLRLNELKVSFSRLIKNPDCFKYAGLLFASFGLMTAWLTLGSVVLQNNLHLSPIQFSWCVLIVGVFYFIASLISSQLVSRLGEDKLISVGGKLLFFPPIILSFALLFGNEYSSIILSVFSVGVGFFATGFIIPNSYSAGVKSFANIAGMAGAFFGFSQMFGGSLYSFMISRASQHTLLPLLISMVITLIVTFFCVNGKILNALLLSKNKTKEML